MKPYDKPTSTITSTIGDKLPKHDPIIEAYGEMDELVAWLSYTRHTLNSSRENKVHLNGVVKRLKEIIETLGKAMTVLADTRDRIGMDMSVFEELRDKLINEVQRIYPSVRPKGFVYVFDGQAANAFNITRTIARRVERKLTQLLENPNTMGPRAEKVAIIQDLVNRLSDWLFVMSLSLSGR